jgi:transcriptional regulator with XRE-family HTH domain
MIIMQKKNKFLKLEFYRRKYKLSQKDVAGLLGVCLSSFNHKVNRITPFDFDEITIIKNEFNKRAKRNGDDLLTIDEIFSE